MNVVGKRTGWVVCGALAVLVLAAVTLFAGIWLLAADPLPEELDVIFTFGGERARDAYSAELVARYPRALWVVSGAVRPAFMAWAASRAIDTAGVLYLDTCSGTWSEVEALRDVLGTVSGAQGPPVAGLVSGPYHMRRIRILVGAILGPPSGRGATIRYLPVPLERYGHTRRGYLLWPFNVRMRRLVFSELKKSAGALLGYRDSPLSLNQ